MVSSFRKFITLVKLKKYIFLIIGIILTTVFIFENNGNRYNFAVLISGYLISIYSLHKMLSINGMPYSLNKIFYIFTFFFLGLAPVEQFKFAVSFWGESFTSNDYLELNTVLIIALVIYDLFYKYFFSRSIIKIKEFKSSKKSFPIKRERAIIVLIFISLCSFLLFFYSLNFNFFALLIRGGIDLKSPLVKSGPLSLVINIFVRPIPVISLIIYRFLYKRFFIYDVIFLIIVLISNAPSGMPRFQAAALYIPIAIAYFRPMSKNVNFSLILSAGTLTIFPLLNIFRNFNSFAISSYKVQNDLFLSVNFDSYNNFMMVLDNKIVTWGHQLLGVIFFFIPRSLWISKPIGSGAFVAQRLNLSFSNISLNFFGEGYINFGYFGIIIFSILIAYINSSLDKRYWERDKFLFFTISYPFMIGMEFFVLRGDLLSSFSYTIGIVLSIYFVFKLVTKRIGVSSTIYSS